MSGKTRSIKVGLLILGVFHLVYFFAAKYSEIAGIKGLLYPDGNPVGGDFINLWSVAKLILSDRVPDIYHAHDFMRYQGTFTGGADIGVRLWAYPPHSLLLAWPFGFFGFYAALTVWSVAGLLVLAWGARRFGFDRLETAIILISPASVLNIYFGQTGSFAAGALLLALSARRTRDAVSIGSAVLLTIKPQAGFLLPVIWTIQRRWSMIIWTACGAIVAVGLAVTLFGMGAWRDYFGDTLPVLSLLERKGSGPFMTMIPSMFMSLRVMGIDSTLALFGHGCFAAAVMVILVLRLSSVIDPCRQAAMLMLATAMITPYTHNYDLVPLLCGALLVARHWATHAKPPFGLTLLVLCAWALPQLVVLFNTVGIPVSPLLILPLLLLA